MEIALNRRLDEYFRSSKLDDDDGLSRPQDSSGAHPHSTNSMKKILLGIAAAVLLLSGVGLARTARFLPAETPITPLPEIAIDDRAAERLAGAIRIPTISHEDSEAFDAAAFQSLHAYLGTEFPNVHARLLREKVAEHSLLYTWTGSDRALKPILLMGHMDVVPVEAGTESKWQEPPFSGRVADGFIWGRGAIDNKSAVVGILEAVEMLLKQGFRPQRTVYIAYGHDEEVGGKRGAQVIAALLRSRGIEFEMVLDEGGVIGDGVLNGISAPTALIGIAEKGFVSVELNAQGEGGHSSLPPRQSAIGILSAAIARLEENPMPARLETPTQQMFARIGPEFPFGQRAVFANLWITRRLVMKKLQENPTTNAMVRTTTATTIFQAGTKDNVLPSRARAVVNFRLLPGDSISRVVQHVRNVINDARVDVKPAGKFTAEPSRVSDINAESYRTIERTVREVVPGVVVSPYLVVVVTDSRYFDDLSANIFRFLPLRLARPDLDRMHGTNERIAIADYSAAIRLYRQLIVNAAGSQEFQGD